MGVNQSLQPTVGSRAAVAQPISELTYIGHVFVHPSNVILLTAIMLVGLVSKSLWALPLALFAQLFMVAVVRQWSVFRGSVERILKEREELARIQARERLFARMRDDHRQQLERLELLVQRIEDEERGVEGALARRLDVRGLLVTYTDAAIEIRRAQEALIASDRGGLHQQIQLLESGLIRGRHCPMAKVRSQRIEVLKKRAARLERSRQRLSILEEQLRTIADLIRLVYEQATEPTGPSLCGDAIESVWADLQASEGVATEVARGVRRDDRQVVTLEVMR